MIGNRRKFKLKGHRLGSEAKVVTIEQLEQALLLQQRALLGRGLRYSQLSPHMPDSYREDLHDAQLAPAGGVLSYIEATATPWVPDVPTTVTLTGTGELALIERNGVSKSVRFDPSQPGQASTITIPASSVVDPTSLMAVMFWRPYSLQWEIRQEIRWVVGTGEVVSPTETIEYENIEFTSGIAAAIAGISQAYWASFLSEGWFPFGVVRWSGPTPFVFLLHAMDGWSFAYAGATKIKDRRRVLNYPSMAHEPPTTLSPSQATNVNDGLFHTVKRISDYFHAIHYGGNAPTLMGTTTGSLTLDQSWYRSYQRADMGSDSVQETINATDLIASSVFTMLAAWRVAPSLLGPDVIYNGPITPIYNRGSNYTLTYTGPHVDVPPNRRFTFTITSAGAPHTLFGVRHIVVGQGVAPWASLGPAESRSRRWGVFGLPSLPATPPAAFTLQLEMPIADLSLNSTLYIYLQGGA